MKRDPVSSKVASVVSVPKPKNAKASSIESRGMAAAHYSRPAMVSTGAADRVSLWDEAGRDT